jgi:hypothetical protein
MKKYRNKRNGHVDITDIGLDNKKKVGQICGELSEQFVEKLLGQITEQGNIVGFRKATLKEDHELQTDFMITLSSGKEIGIQVKSSITGVADFISKDHLYGATRGYPVMPFIAKPTSEEQTEEKRLIREILTFQEFLKKTTYFKYTQ